MGAYRSAWIAISLFLAPSCGLLITPPAWTQSTPAPSGKGYEAEVEHYEGTFKFQSHVLYDRGRFRKEDRYAGPSGRPAVRSVEVYDGSRPSIVWGYQSGQPSAWPSLESCHAAMNDAARQLGESVTRKRYNIPATYPYIRHVGVPLVQTGALLTRTTLARLTWRQDKHEQVAGYRCDVLIGEYRSSSVTTVQRAWIEPRTEVVLRWEQRIVPPANAPIPPARSGYIVRDIRFVENIPAARFQLPPGATANVPAIFSAVRLPPGVKRVPAHGPFAGVGIDFTGRSLGAAVVPDRK